MKKILLIMALECISINSYADTYTANLEVSAQIATNCTISMTAVTFANYDPIVTNKSADLLDTGKVTTTCTNGSSVKITLGQGLNADTGSTDAAPLRQMASGTNRLAYFLYSDSGRTTVWGDTVDTSKADTGTGVASELTVYGRMPANQNKPAKSDYVDTVRATVTF
jgi:spore coat protein U-like protein